MRPGTIDAIAEAIRLPWPHMVANLYQFPAELISSIELIPDGRGNLEMIIVTTDPPLEEKKNARNQAS